jgi:hypothetical protein
MFAKPAAEVGKEEPQYGGDDSDGMYAEPDEPPSVTLGAVAAQESPFSKVIEKTVDKFKVTAPGPSNEKQNCGNGRLSI